MWTRTSLRKLAGFKLKTTASFNMRMLMENEWVVLSTSLFSMACCYIDASDEKTEVARNKQIIPELYEDTVL